MPGKDGRDGAPGLDGEKVCKVLLHTAGRVPQTELAGLQCSSRSLAGKLFLLKSFLILSLVKESEILLLVYPEGAP